MELSNSICLSDSCESNTSEWEFIEQKISEKMLKKIEKNDRSIHIYFQIIKDNILGKEGIKLYSLAKKSYEDWEPIRNEVIDLLEKGDKLGAIAITINKGATHVSKLEYHAEKLHEYARLKGSKFKNDADSFFKNTEDWNGN